MMMDTLKITDRLTRAGSEEKLAREHATILQEVVDHHAATKADLREAMLHMKLFMVTLTMTTSTAIVGILAAIKYWG